VIRGSDLGGQQPVLEAGRERGRKGGLLHVAAFQAHKFFSTEAGLGWRQAGSWARLNGRRCSKAS